MTACQFAFAALWDRDLIEMQQFSWIIYQTSSLNFIAVAVNFLHSNDKCAIVWLGNRKVEDGILIPSPSQTIFQTLPIKFSPTRFILIKTISTEISLTKTITKRVNTHSQEIFPAVKKFKKFEND